MRCWSLARILVKFGKDDDDSFYSSCTRGVRKRCPLLDPRPDALIACGSTTQYHPVPKFAIMMPSLRSSRQGAVFQRSARARQTRSGGSQRGTLHCARRFGTPAIRRHETCWPRVGSMTQRIFCDCLANGCFDNRNVTTLHCIENSPPYQFAKDRIEQETPNEEKKRSERETFFFETFCRFLASRDEEAHSTVISRSVVLAGITVRNNNSPQLGRSRKHAAN